MRKTLRLAFALSCLFGGAASAATVMISGGDPTLTFTIPDASTAGATAEGIPFALFSQKPLGGGLNTVPVAWHPYSFDMPQIYSGSELTPTFAQASCALLNNETAGHDILTTTTCGLVPEPTTWALLLAGVGLAGGSMRRRRREALSV